ncbi:glycogen synthase [Clostridium sp. 'White wine YQ']|uniref:glycogen synthase n=1 Tax=Clostridium sp. 'White wine YQ' TaxID=3027474 RepID=UPI002365F139|nr:glycogen/starch synthase [Clostridium sp. 'White wine YQ']MDD7796423.1 glycogen/starch synthase [Clostridium sp. 'White wine YQ']
MKVLFVSVEAYPFMKVGGLGDVAHGLPKALKGIGVDVRIIMPKYKLAKKLKKKLKFVTRFKTYIGWKTIECSLWSAIEDGLQYYFIDNPFYFYRENAYGYGDDEERFIAFSKGVLESIKYIGDFTPDIIHCNEWHSSLIIPLKKIYYEEEDKYKSIKTVFTIHNIMYQGQCHKDMLWMLGIDEEKYYKEDELKNNEGINMMKWAIKYADKVTTVSPSYAEEIKEEHNGFGLSKFIKDKGEDFKGILNGIDYEVFNPEEDSNLFRRYNIDSIQLKRENKIELQRELGLEEDCEIPLVSLVSRLTEQKGIGLLISNIDELMRRDIQLVIAGTGQTIYEESLKILSEKYKGRLAVILKFDISISSRIYGASDLFLIPSKFEPCGLTQMISMRYGTLPLVRETGGLKDTVKEFNNLTGIGNGFTFKNYSAIDMIEALDRALTIYKNKEMWNLVQKNAMLQDNSWNLSAKEYYELYKNA